MKYLAIFLIVLVLALTGVVIYQAFNTSLVVVGKGFNKLAAADNPQEFAALQNNVANESVIGTIYQADALINPSDYSYYVYTLRLKNNGLLPMEMVEIQVAAGDSDILSYTDSSEISIKPGQTRDVWCVLVVKGEPHTVRQLHITYYIWGRPYRVKFTYEP